MLPLLGARDPQGGCGASCSALPSQLLSHAALAPSSPSPTPSPSTNRPPTMYRPPTNCPFSLLSLPLPLLLPSPVASCSCRVGKRAASATPLCLVHCVAGEGSITAMLLKLDRWVSVNQ